MLDGTVGIGEGLIVAGDISWTDYSFTAPVRILADSRTLEASLVFRFVDSSNFYWAGLGPWAHRVSIGRRVAGISLELAYAGTRSELVAGKTYLLSVKVVGNVIAFYVDGVLALTVTDTSIAAGKIGFRPYNSHIEADYADAVTPGNTVTFSGSVTAQATSGETVTLKVTKPDSIIENLYTVTKDDKTFTYTKSYAVQGQYSVVAHLDADSQYIAIDTSKVVFNVPLLSRTATVAVT